MVFLILFFHLVGQRLHAKEKTILFSTPGEGFPPYSMEIGYIVTSKTSSIETLEAFMEQPSYFDLVISDMKMPNLTDLQLSDRLLAIRPDIPIILCTGFSDMIDQKKVKSLGIKEILMKPLTYNQFAVAIRKALDGKGEPILGR